MRDEAPIRGGSVLAPPMTRAAAAVLALLLAAGTVPAAGEVVTLTATRDNTLFQDATGSLSNGAGPVMFAGRNSQGLARRALVRFDLEGSVPADAVVSEVQLTLNLSNVSDPMPRIFTLHRLQRDWGEGTSTGTGGGGAPATSGDATWLHAFWPGTSWSNAGGDFEPAASASQWVGDLGVYTWTGSRVVSDVQAWLDDPDTHFGWILVGDETAVNTARRFDSHENTVVANRPSLTVTYSFPTAVAFPAIHGASLAPCRPNPATGPVTFAFSIPAAGHVELTVTDVTGRRVATLVDRLLGPGRHEVGWSGVGLDGRRTPAGVYVYRLSLGGELVATRRWTVVH